jgi:hypothetical protein
MELDDDNNIALNNLLEAAEAEELQMNQLSPVQDLNSGITVKVLKVQIQQTIPLLRLQCFLIWKFNNLLSTMV